MARLGGVGSACGMAGASRQQRQRRSRPPGLRDGRRSSICCGRRNATSICRDALPPRKLLELSDRDDPASPTVPALQLELHHHAPRSLLCMDATFCVLRCRVSRRTKLIAGAGGESLPLDAGTKMWAAMILAALLEQDRVRVGVDGDPQSPGASRMEQDAPWLQPPLTLLCHPGRRFSAGERWRLRVGMGGDLVAIGTSPPTLLSLPFPCISCLAVRCVRYPGLRRTTHAALGMRACCVRRSGCRREGLRAVLTAVSAYKNREKCCPDCVGVCAECVQVNPIFHVHVTPSPWTHTHVAPLHKHAHPVSQKVPLEGEGKGSRVAKGSWGASDGVESTPQHALEQPNLPLFSTLFLALSTPVGSCPPKTSRNSATQQ